MKKINGIILSALFLVFLMTLASAINASAQEVFMYCSFDTSSFVPQKGAKDRFERRFYVTEIISTSKKDFLDADGKPERIEGKCGDYFEKTVFKAATERGERIDPSGTLKVVRSIEHTDDGYGYKYAKKEAIEKIRAEAVKEAEDAGRITYIFSWDLSGKNEATDLQKEVKRSSPMLSSDEKKPN